MRITMITSKMNFVSGGGSVFDLDVTARFWQKLGHDVKFVTVFSAYNDFPADLPYPIVPEQIGSARLLGIQKGIYDILKKHQAETDVYYIECHAYLYGAGLYRLFGGNTPIVAFFNRELTAWPQDASKFFTAGAHSDSYPIRVKQKIRFWIEKYLGTPLANRMDILTFTNPILQKGYHDFGLKKANNIITGDPFNFKKLMAENGITENFYAARNQATGPITLFYSSRMAAGKGFDLLLAAFAKIKHKENYCLVLGGTGPEEALVRQTVHDLGLVEYVTMPGWVPRAELFNSLKSVDIFIQARWRTDMTSTSLLFAMAFGLPCILPGGGGLEWVAKDAALFFNDGDPADLARAIEELGTNPELRAKLSHHCYTRLADPEINYEFVLSKLAERMQSLLTK